jgi:tellurite resistance protein TerC
MLGEYSILEILVFCLLVIVALVVDLHAHKADEPIPVRSALKWYAFWVSLALAFALYVSISHSWEHGQLFFIAYLLEVSLSMDNLFVFMAIFSAFAVKDEYQYRLLYYGILVAIILRVIFLSIGTALLLLGKWVLVIFGLFVLWSAWKMWEQSRKDKEEIVDYTNHWSVSFARRFFPVYPKVENNNFFARIDGALHCTPLFLCIVVVAIADIMFAIDSVPAVIGVTQEIFLIYTSNIFAVLGLRCLFFVLSEAKRFLVHLEKAVIVILAYIGVKMLIGAFDILHIPAMTSLAVVGILLTSGVVASLLFPAKEEQHQQL